MRNRAESFFAQWQKNLEEECIKAQLRTRENNETDSLIYEKGRKVTQIN